MDLQEWDSFDEVVVVDNVFVVVVVVGMVVFDVAVEFELAFVLVPMQSLEFVDLENISEILAIACELPNANLIVLKQMILFLFSE